METNISPSAPAATPATAAIAQSIGRYVSQLEGIKQAIQIAMPLIGAENTRATTTFEAFVTEAKIRKTEKDDSTSFSIPIAKYATFELLQRKRDALRAAYLQTPRALLVALVSSYDAYLGSLLKSLFYLKPAMLNASQRGLKFEDLVALGSIELAREFLVEKEVESIIRESHTTQFDWMEGRFGVVLRKDLAAWPIFIEVTERRNLFVHTDGIISRQYLDVCSANGVDLSGRSIGRRLGVPEKYFAAAFDCLFEIGVKLGHVLWRKLAPDDLAGADEALIGTTFELLQRREYRLAKCLLEFANHTLKKHSSSSNRRIFVVNLAIAYRWGGTPTRAAELIEKEDWSDCDHRFQLASAVLQERYKHAAAVMAAMGSEAKGITRVGYETWPLFQDFRRTDEFKTTFKKIYGTDFVIEVDPAVAADAIQDSGNDPKVDSAEKVTPPLPKAAKRRPVRKRPKKPA